MINEHEIDIVEEEDQTSKFPDINIKRNLTNRSNLTT